MFSVSALYIHVPVPSNFNRLLSCTHLLHVATVNLLLIAPCYAIWYTIWLHARDVYWHQVLIEWNPSSFYNGYIWWTHSTTSHTHSTTPPHTHTPPPHLTHTLHHPTSHTHTLHHPTSHTHSTTPPHTHTGSICGPQSKRQFQQEWELQVSATWLLIVRGHKVQ